MHATLFLLGAHGLPPCCHLPRHAVLLSSLSGVLPSSCFAIFLRMQSLRHAFRKRLKSGKDAEGGMAMEQEDTSEFLNGLLTALEHILLHQAGSPAKLDARSKVCLAPPTSTSVSF